MRTFSADPENCAGAVPARLFSRPVARNLVSSYCQVVDCGNGTAGSVSVGNQWPSPSWRRPRLRVAGRNSKGPRRYQDFLNPWKDADPDIPILKQAKAEYANLQ